MRVLGIREKVRKERVNVSRRIVTCWRITVKTRPSTLCSSRYDHARRRRSKLLQDRYASTDGPWRQSIKPTLTPAAVSCSEEATNLLCWCLGAYVEGEFVRRMGAHMHMAQSSHPSLRAYLTPAVADEARAPRPPPRPSRQEGSCARTSVQVPTARPGSHVGNIPRLHFLGHRQLPILHPSIRIAPAPPDHAEAIFPSPAFPAGLRRACCHRGTSPHGSWRHDT